jgi:hypothetical protein
MSTTELNKGVIRPTSKSLEEIVDELVKEVPDEEVPSWYNGKREYVEERFIMEIEDQLYIIDLEIAQDEFEGYFAEFDERGGEIHFFTCHYNGGGHWKEIIEGYLTKKGRK